MSFSVFFKCDVFIVICLNERVSVCVSYRNFKVFFSMNVVCRGEIINKGSMCFLKGSIEFMGMFCVEF